MSAGLSIKDVLIYFTNQRGFSEKRLGLRLGLPGLQQTAQGGVADLVAPLHETLPTGRARVLLVVLVHVDVRVDVRALAEGAIASLKFTNKLRTVAVRALLVDLERCELLVVVGAWHCALLVF